MLPAFGMHLAYLSTYPEILEQEIPNAWIAERLMPAVFSGFFVIVLNLVILQTAVGLLQGIIERIEAWSLRAEGERLSKRAHALISAVCLAACLGLSVFGVQKLLGWMYDISYWYFLVVFLIPLLTVGVYRISTAGSMVRNEAST
jgi:uncharacterized membrane protein YkvI